jgi:hypothetical protein
MIAPDHRILHVESRLFYRDTWGVADDRSKAHQNPRPAIATLSWGHKAPAEGMPGISSLLTLH